MLDNKFINYHLPISNNPKPVILFIITSAIKINLLLVINSDTFSNAIIQLQFPHYVVICPLLLLVFLIPLLLLPTERNSVEIQNFMKTRITLQLALETTTRDSYSKQGKQTIPPIIHLTLNTFKPSHAVYCLLRRCLST